MHDHRRLAGAGRLDRPRRMPTGGSRLRAAGAVILGKTNLSEWANFRSTHSVSGWSSRGGQTRNPYALDRNPCGSSSGSAVAVAANLCAAAVGTETDGSIICPAHDQRHRRHQAHRWGWSAAPASSRSPTARTPPARWRAPSRTRPSCWGRWRTTTGPPRPPPCEGRGERTPLSSQERGGGEVGLHPLPGRGGLSGARIGVARNFCGFNPRVDAVFEASLAALARPGRGDRRPGEHRDGQADRRTGIRGAAVRVQGRSERLPGRTGIRLHPFTRWRK